MQKKSTGVAVMAAATALAVVAALLAADSNY